MKKGDIVLVPFPFTDQSGNKNRPAVVLISSHTDVTLCFITTELKWQEEFDVTINPNETNGLKKTSLIRVSKIATIDSDLVIGRLGSLSDLDLMKLNKALIKVLKLDYINQ